MFDTVLDPLTITLIVLCSIVIWYYMSLPSNLPPGPVALPVIGCLGRFDRKDEQKSYKEYREKYGDVFSFRLGNNLYIVINGYEMITEFMIHNGSKFANRPDSFLFGQLYKHRGIIASEGQNWHDQRQFTMTYFKEVGIGSVKQEEIIMPEIDTLTSIIDSKDGNPFYLKDLAPAFTCNVMCKIIFGRTFEYGNEQFVKLLHCVNDMFNKQTYTSLMNYFPVLKYLPFDLFNTKDVIDSFNNLQNDLQDLVEEQKRSWKPSQPRHFIDTYLNEQQRRKHVVGSNFTDEQLLQTVSDLYIAGTETSSTAISLAVLLLLQYPDVQSKIRQEILQVFEKTPPSLTFQSRLPYTQAFITELHRFAALVKNIPRAAIEDTHIGGYLIPKKATLIFNVETVEIDSDYFLNPYEFKPERFLNEDGEFIKNSRQYVFGAGKRKCFGEALAQAEIFLFLTSILQKYKLEAEFPGNIPAINDFEVNIVINPKPHRIKAIKIQGL